MNENETHQSIAKCNEQELLIEDFKDTSSKLEATDHKVQFFIQLYIAFLTALISGGALYLVNSADSPNSNILTTGYDDVSLPYRMTMTQMQRVLNEKPTDDLKLYRTRDYHYQEDCNPTEQDSMSEKWLPEKYYKLSANKKSWYLQFEPNKYDRKLMHSCFMYLGLSFSNDHRYTVLAILIVFLSLLTKFLWCYVKKATKVHSTYIEKLNIIRFLVYESSAINRFDKELFIYDKTEKYKRAGMSGEIEWLLSIVLVFLTLSMIGFLVVLIKHSQGFVTMRLTQSTTLALICLFSLALMVIFFSNQLLSFGNWVIRLVKKDK